MAGVIYDLTGKRFGKLQVLKKSEKRYASNRGVHWLCKCDCGNETHVVSNSLRAGRTSSCGCYGKIAAWKGYEEISSSYWTIIKNGARARNLDFDITIEYAWALFVKQNRICKLSGLPLSFTRDRRKEKQTASLDRIDSTNGYVKGNIQWVHVDINWLKQDFKESYFLELCEHVAIHNRRTSKN